MYRAYSVGLQTQAAFLTLDRRAVFSQLTNPPTLKVKYSLLCLLCEECSYDKVVIILLTINQLMNYLAIKSGFNHVTITITLIIANLLTLTIRRHKNRFNDYQITD